MIYLASPYTSPDPLIMKTRFLVAEQVTAKLIEEGHYIYSPIVHCHEMAAKYSFSTDFNFWRGYNLDMIRRADAFYILSIAGWRESRGVTDEFEFARMCQLEVAYVSAEGKVTCQP